MLSTDQVIHYDHIVPLNCWSVNDPCNLQLLCEECNLKKGGIHASTSIRYREWW
ncbi:MAG: HNH endonuclease [Desulfobacterales bacterium]|nr:HNH endonuclease [Desulfobacterales bacterium]